MSNPFLNSNVSQAYSEADFIYQTSAKKIIEIINPQNYPKDFSYADIGCGTGVSSQVILESGAKILTLIDPSKPMLELARERLASEVTYLQAGIEQLSEHHRNSFDIAYALNCFHLIENVAGALISVSYALKEKGIFVFNISAPSFGFNNVTDDEKKILLANIDFYQDLNNIVDNPILSRTIELLKSNLEVGFRGVFTQGSLGELLRVFGFNDCEYHEISLETSIEYQKNIWRMMAKNFLSDEKQIEKNVDKVTVPKTMSLRQAVFVASKI